VIFAQLEETQEVAFNFAKEFGVIALLLVATLTFLGFVVYKFGSRLVDSLTDNNDRLTTSTEKISDAIHKSSEVTVGIGVDMRDIARDVKCVATRQDNHMESMKLALEAAKTDDMRDRHSLIDQARRKLDG